MTKVVSAVNTFVWGAPALLLILGVGIYLSIRLRFAQITLFPSAVCDFFRKLRPEKESGTSSFRALCTALAATVGTGNLVGVAGAICLGGPGSVFWMWICGIFGMIIKYAEAVLAVHYREKNSQGYVGGPMYVIARGLGKRWYPLAVCYSVFGIAASFGVGNAAQVNAMISGINGVISQFGGVPSLISNGMLGVLLAAVIGAVLLGGAKRIGIAAERLVPFAATAYLLMSVVFLVKKADAIPGAFYAIVHGAMNPKAVTGGVLGSAFQAMRIGCSRGVFTNEAGMGTASIAHASAEVAHPAQQGLMGMMEVFLDTLVICTLTALVILCSGVSIPYGTDIGPDLTAKAFAVAYGQYAPIFLAMELTLFALATVLGWGLYGVRCAQFLFGSNAWKPFAFLQIVTVIFGAVLESEAVWQFSELFNGLMAIPNLLTLAVLTPEVVRLTKDFKKSGAYSAGGGNYADFHQCKPL